MKHQIIVSILSILLCTGALQAKTYYIDSERGSDGNSGTSRTSPWKSTEQVNRTTFQPGDSVLFACHGVWYKPLMPKGSGTAEAPIVLSSYGSGYPPLFIGDGITSQGVIRLYNQSFWEITNLEITNDADDYGDRKGVEIVAENYGIARHIHLKNLRIHHIKGIPGNDARAKRTTGIFFVVRDDREKPTRFDDLLIEGCTIHDVINQGIVLNNERFETTGYPGEGAWEAQMFTRVVIRNNVIYNISKNAMIIRMTEKGLVEHNLCFNTATMTTGNTIFSRNAKETLFQYNEGFLNKSHDHDGSFYDPDLNSPGTVWQYSYSHHNAQGLLWICTREKDTGVVVRDNISENDHGFLVYFNYAFQDASVYRNIFFAQPDLSPFLIRENPNNRHLQIRFSDNIILNQSSRFTFEFRPEDALKSKKNSNNRQFENNHFFGNELLGTYERGYGELPAMKRFHRGLHHPPDALDSLMSHPASGIPLPAAGQKKVVATIRGNTIYASELNREKSRLRPLLLAKNRSLDEEELTQCALRQLAFKKIQLEWMGKKRLFETAILTFPDHYMEQENRFRRENATMDETVWFGPQQFNLADYEASVWALAVEKLKRIMMKNELKMSEAELREHALTGDKDRIGPAWERRGFDYSIRAIETSLLDQKYDAFFKEIARSPE